MVIRSTQGAEDILNKCEKQLRDVNKVPVNEKEVEANQTQLQVQCLSHKHPVMHKAIVCGNLYELEWPC